MAKVIAHTVFFWLKEPLNKMDKDTLTQGLQALRCCPLIASAQIGLPAPTVERDVMDQSFDVSFIVYFNSVADQDAYQIHSLHQDFIDQCGHLWANVKVHDSVLISAT